MVHHHLVHQGDEGGAVGWRRLLHLAGVRVHPFHWRDIQGTWKEINDPVEEGLNTPVSEGSATEHGNELEANGGLSDARHKHLWGYRGFRKIGLHNLIIKLRYCFHKRVPVFPRTLCRIFGYIRDLEGRPQGRLLPDELFHVQEIDNALKGLLTSHRYLHEKRIGPQPAAHHLNRSKKISAGPIEFVDKGDFRHAVLIRLVPNGF